MTHDIHEKKMERRANINEEKISIIQVVHWERW